FDGAGVLVALGLQRLVRLATVTSLQPCPFVSVEIFRQVLDLALQFRHLGCKRLLILVDLVQRALQRHCAVVLAKIFKGEMKPAITLSVMFVQRFIDTVEGFYKCFQGHWPSPWLLRSLPGMTARL